MIVYNPYDVFVVQRNATSSSFVEKVLSSAPNTLFFFDSASNVVALPSESLISSTASYAEVAAFTETSSVVVISSSSYAETASVALNVPDTASYAVTSSFALESPGSVSASHAVNADTSISASHAVNADTSISASHSLNSDYAIASTSASHALRSDTGGSSDSASYLNPGASIYLSQSYIFADTSSDAPPLIPGQMWWDSVNHTYAIDAIQSRLQIGQEMYARALAGEFIPNGAVVRYNGVGIDPHSPTNKLPMAYLALADEAGLSASVVGVSTQDMSVGEEGFITTQGVVNDLNTFAFDDSDVVYLSADTPGVFTRDIPNDPYPKIVVGTVTYSHPSIGRLLVNVQILPSLSSPYVGMIEVPSFVDNHNQTFTVGSASANFCVTPDGLGQIKTYTVPQTSFSSSVGTYAQYVLATYNSGSPIFISTTDQSLIDEIQTIPVFSFVLPVSGSTISPLDWDAAGVLLANKLHSKTIDVDGVQRASGLNLSVTGSKYIAIASGSVWYGVKNKNLPSTDTTNTLLSPLSFYYHSGGNWVAINKTDGFYINDKYDDGTDLQTASYGSYIVNYVYRAIGTANRTLILLSNALPTLTEAQIFIPPDIPDYFNGFTTLVGRIIVQSGSWVPTSVDSAFKATLPITITPQHNDLTNIQGGTASLNANEYYHLTSASYARIGAGSLDTASYLNPGASFYIVSGSGGIPQAYIETYDLSPVGGVNEEYVPPFKEGRMFYDHRHNGYAFYTQDSGFRAHPCKETLVGVHNPSSVTIPRLSVVYISGSSIAGQYRPDIYLAVATDGGIRSEAIGVVRSKIESGSYGYVLMQGIMHRTKMDFDIDGNPLMVGDRLWLHPTIPGGITKTEPGQPYQQVALGYCSEYGESGSFIVDRNKYPPPPNAYAGVTSDIIVSNLNDGTVGVSTGSVNLFADSTGFGLVSSYPLAEATLSLITGSTNYIVVEHTGSLEAKYTLTTDPSYANGTNIVRVSQMDIYTGDPEGTEWDVHDFDVGIIGLALANRINNKDIKLYGFQRQDGLTLYATGSSGSFGITEGNVWYGPNSHVVPTFDTTLPGYYTYIFHTSGSGWHRHTSSVLISGEYDNGAGSSSLTPCAPDSWSVNFVYRIIGTTDEAAIVMSNNQFATELEASNNGQTPPNLPSTIRDQCLLIGRFIVQSGSFTPTIESAFSNIFVPAVVTNHESLLGLQGGQGGEHYHMTQADYIGTGTGLMVRQYNPTCSVIKHLGATPGHVPYWTELQTLAYTGSIQVIDQEHLTINSGSFPDPTNPETLLIRQTHSESVNIIGAYSNQDSFSQLYVQNVNSGSSASADIVATADVGGQYTNFIDMGIANSGYTSPTWPWTKALDGYLLVDGGDLWLATDTDNKLLFAFNNTASTDYADRTGFYLSGSFFGTSSRAISASWSPNQGATTLVTASIYEITSSRAISASWAPAAAPITSVPSSSWASQSLSASYAPVEPDYSSSVSTAKQNALVVGGTYQITSSWTNNAVSASWAPDQTVAVSSASWASSSISSSFSDTSSYTLGIPTIKSGIVSGASFGGTPQNLFSCIRKTIY